LQVVHHRANAMRLENRLELGVTAGSPHLIKLHHRSHDLEARCAPGSINDVGRTVRYFGNGSKAFPKERLKDFRAGRVLQLDNFQRLRGYAWLAGLQGLGNAIGHQSASAQNAAAV
jgi:hypothetical protein